jgi:hypothetical protein
LCLRLFERCGDLMDSLRDGLRDYLRDDLRDDVVVDRTSLHRVNLMSEKWLANLCCDSVPLVRVSFSLTENAMWAGGDESCPSMGDGRA